MKNSFRSHTIKGLILLAMGFILSSHAQNLKNSRDSSFFTYIYKITDSEAQDIYQTPHWKYNPAVFHTLIDSFPTDSIYKKTLPIGHYLKTLARTNVEEIEITSINTFHVFIFNNTTDLNVQVYDETGKIISDALVSIDDKVMQYHPLTQTFTLTKTNKQGLLKVEYDGQIGFYDVNRHFNNAWIKRSYIKTMFKPPLKYVWLPIRFTYRLPYDGVKSIVKGYTYGSIGSTKRFFVKLYRKTECLVNPYNCFDYNYFENKFNSYVISDKPMYRPNDTLRVKTYISKKNGKPINRSIYLSMYNGKKSLNLGKIKPIHPGSYVYELVLHDSLQMRLDQSYTLNFSNKKDEDYTNFRFLYKDYELKNNTLEINLAKLIYFEKDSIILNIKATDANDLTLKDAKAEVLIKFNNVMQYRENQVFVADTLYFQSHKILSKDPTRIAIATTHFPKADFNAKVYVKLTTSDNEILQKSTDFIYKIDQKNFDFEMLPDSVGIAYKVNGLRQNTHAKVWAKLNNQEEELVYEGEIPTSILLNPLYESLRVENDERKEFLNINSLSDAFRCYSVRTGNQVEIKVENPYNIGFHYDIFKKNQRIEKGFTHQLHFIKKEKSTTDYYIFINYVWAGQVKQLSYKVPLDMHKMNIEVTQNKVVYPGQTTEVEIALTDDKGKPISNADVSAFALTKKFDYKLPQLPIYTKKTDFKDHINSFSIKDNKHKKVGNYRLNYQFWQQKAQIDSIAYYQFTYPQNDLYRFEYDVTDSITQFAPFVFRAGEKLPIHVVYVDNKPVYFDWNTNFNPYSMRINPGFHQIKLRTDYAEYLLDSVYFNKGKKLIFSLNDSIQNHNVQKYKREVRFSDSEKKFLFPYTFNYRLNFQQNDYVSIENQGNLMLLHPYTIQNFNTIQTTGPVSGYVSLHYNLSDVYKNFFYESAFDYEFTSDWVKMRERKNNLSNIVNLNSNQMPWDSVLTQTMIDDWMVKNKEIIRKETYHYNNPIATNPGKGRMLIMVWDVLKNEINFPLNSILVKPNDPLFFRFYNGNNAIFHDLESGDYELVLLYADGYYTKTNLLHIQPDGVNYFKIELPETLSNDALGVKFNQMLMTNVSKTYDNKEKPKNNQVMEYQNQYYDLTYDTSKGVLVQGYVSDVNGPLPGVNVLIKGTKTGTETDFDGYYSIIVPIGYELMFSYVGMVTESRSVNGSSVYNIKLDSDENHLDEVVITAMGFSGTKKILTVSTSTIEGSLSGKVAGLTITNASGIPGSSQQVVLRGMNSMNDDFGSKALIVVNGVIFNGNLSDLNIDQFTTVNVIKDASGVALYGSKAQNGVILINTNQSLPNLPTNPELKEAEILLPTDLMQSSLRDNFNDVAYWQPSLLTDAQGKAKFSVTYPDDITTWDAHVIAVKNKKVGSVSAKIKSYKPLMAQLFTPRFMVEGDTSVFIGKTTNLVPEKLNLTHQFEINNQNKWSKNREVGEFLIDSLQVIAPKDTLKVKYFLQKPDGYFDGELRDIPIFPIGMEKTLGQFYILQNDTLIVPKLQLEMGNAKLSFKSDLLDVMLDEIENVKYYKYDCNEQMASKLKAFLAEENIKTSLGEKFMHRNEVEKIIRKLKKNENSFHLWGWWNVSETTPWISLHVAEALGKALKMGYKVDVDKTNLANALIWMYQNTQDFDTKIRMIKIGKALDLVMNYDLFYEDLKQFSLTDFTDELQLMEVNQLLGKKADVDKILKNKQETLLGNIYFKTYTKQKQVFTNDLMNTLKAYKIIQSDTLLRQQYKNDLLKMRNYFLENRKSGYWTNTYESVQILETILPDLLVINKKYTKPEVEITGDIQQKVTSFPFEMEFNPQKQIQISKQGTSTIYMDISQKYWETHPEVTKNDFEIITRFSNNTNLLKAGKEETLIVTLNVKKEAEYIMINVPIPAGCSYADSQNRHTKEVHREQFKHETSIFCNNLTEGTYMFEVKLNPRYSGSYTLNPAKVELMYFPTFNANNELKKVKIE